MENIDNQIIQLIKLQGKEGGLNLQISDTDRQIDSIGNSIEKVSKEKEDVILRGQVAESEVQSASQELSNAEDAEKQAQSKVILAQKRLKESQDKRALFTDDLFKEFDDKVAQLIEDKEEVVLQRENLKAELVNTTKFVWMGL